MCVCASRTEQPTPDATSETPAVSTPVPSTAKPTLGPNDLTSTDYIIIGVTSAVALSVIVGGIVFCCIKSKE